MAVNNSSNRVQVGQIRRRVSAEGTVEVLVVAGPFADQAHRSEWMVVPLDRRNRQPRVDETVVVSDVNWVACVWAARPVVASGLSSIVAIASTADVDAAIDRLISIEEGKVVAEVSFEETEERQASLKYWKRAFDLPERFAPVYFAISNTEQLPKFERYVVDESVVVVRSLSYWDNSFLQLLGEGMPALGSAVYIAGPPLTADVSAASARIWGAPQVLFEKSFRVVSGQALLSSMVA